MFKDFLFLLKLHFKRYIKFLCVYYVIFIGSIFFGAKINVELYLLVKFISMIYIFHITFNYLYMEKVEQFEQFLPIPLKMVFLEKYAFFFCLNIILFVLEIPFLVIFYKSSVFTFFAPISYFNVIITIAFLLCDIVKPSISQMFFYFIAIIYFLKQFVHLPIINNANFMQPEIIILYPLLLVFVFIFHWNRRM
jgi:hypothetical protein